MEAEFGKDRQEAEAAEGRPDEKLMTGGRRRRFRCSP